jgi:hypothetical protein
MTRQTKKSPAQLDREIAEALAQAPSKAELKVYAIDASIVSGVDGEDVWKGRFEIPADNARAASKLAVDLLRESTYYDPRIDPRAVLDSVEHVGEVEIMPRETRAAAAETLIAEARRTIP